MLVNDEITVALREKNLVELVKLLELTNNEQTELQEYINNDRFPKESLKKILITRDKKSLCLQNIEIFERNVSSIEFEKEIENYNSVILTNNSSNITVLQAKDKNGKNVLIYYYDEGALVGRQFKLYNINGDLEKVSHYSIFDNGLLTEENNATIVYKYNDENKKNYSIKKDDLSGITFYEYNQYGTIKFSISKDAICENFSENEKNYTICDGYFKPLESGYKHKFFDSAKDLQAEELKRTFVGEIHSEEKKKLLKDFNIEKKENVLSIMRFVEPAFKEILNIDLTDLENVECQRTFAWFDGFSKRIMLNSQKSNQSDKVIELMKKFNGKNIDEINRFDDFLNNKRNEIDEKYEGEKYGNF